MARLRTLLTAGASALAGLVVRASEQHFPTESRPVMATTGLADALDRKRAALAPPEPVLRAPQRPQLAGQAPWKPSCFRVVGAFMLPFPQASRGPRPAATYRCARRNAAKLARAAA